MSSIPLLLFLFLLKNLPATSFALLIKEKRERERQRERRKTGGSAFTMPSEIEVHHALPRPPSHRRSSSSLPPGWVRSACSFLSYFIFAWYDSTLFYKNWNLFCVMCLDYVRNWVRSACSFFFFFIFACSDSTLF